MYRRSVLPVVYISVGFLELFILIVLIVYTVIPHFSHISDTAVKLVKKSPDLIYDVFDIIAEYDEEEYINKFHQEVSDYDSVKIGDTSFLIIRDEVQTTVYEYRSSVNIVTNSIISYILMFVIIYLIGLLIFFRYYSLEYIRPMNYLRDLLKKEVYNLQVKPVETQLRLENMDAITRGIKEIITEFNIRNKLLLDQSKRFEYLSYTDGLTQQPNRVALNRELDNKETWIDKYSAVCFLLMDIDYFKQFNDHYGHVLGDKIIQKVGYVFKSICYPHNDFWARYGGEEFAVLLRNTSLNTGLKVAERIRSAIETMKILHEKSSVSNYLTCSIGLAANIPGVYIDPDTLLKTADSALYESKRSGRNRICYKTPIEIPVDDLHDLIHREL